MAVILTNLSNRPYEESRLRLNRSAEAFGISNQRSYDFEDLKSSSFYQDNRAILDSPTGMGYWLWKPYIILQALNDAADGDIVVYADSGLEIIASLEPLFQICHNGNPVLLFGNGDFSNAMWTKRDCFILMNCDQPYFWKAPQCDASFCLFQKSESSLRFVREWLEFCRDPRILTDDLNSCNRRNLPDFIEHRRDQSVLSLLAAKYRLSLFRMPSQYGNHYKVPALRIEKEFNCVSQYYRQQVDYYALIPYSNSPYVQLLDHHRSQYNPPPKISKFELVSWIIRKRYNRWMNAYALRNEMRKRNPNT